MATITATGKYKYVAFYEVIDDGDELANRRMEHASEAGAVDGIAKNAYDGCGHVEKWEHTVECGWLPVGDYFLEVLNGHAERD